MKVTANIKEVDKGYNRLKQTLSKLNRGQNSVDVGLFGEGKVKETAKSSKAKSITAPELVIIGATHEFGSPQKNIPERSYLRATLQEHKDEVTALFSQRVPELLLKGEDVKKFLDKIGVWFTGLVQKKIVTGPFKKLKQKTIDAKGSSKPLIDTGRLRQSITYRVVTK